MPACVCMHVCVYVCMYIYRHTHTHTHICVYVCICIHIHTHPHTHTHTHTHAGMHSACRHTYVRDQYPHTYACPSGPYSTHQSCRADSPQENHDWVIVELHREHDALILNSWILRMTLVVCWIDSLLAYMRRTSLRRCYALGLCRLMVRGSCGGSPLELPVGVCGVCDVYVCVYVYMY